MSVTPIRILVVEDFFDDIVVLQKAFRDAKIANEIETVGTGGEALAALRASVAPEAPKPMFDLLILDLGLPDMGGLDVLREVRGDPRLAHLSVIVLTISDQDGDIIRSYDLGVQAFVQKPVRMHNLADYFLGDVRFQFVVTRSPDPA